MKDSFGNRLYDIIQRFPEQRILVLGDLMLDEYIWGEAHRVSPEAPVPVVEVCSRSYTAGGAANVAANISILGGKVMLAGVVGDDTPGRSLLRELDKLNIDCNGVVIESQKPTTTKTRIIAQNQQIVRVDTEEKRALTEELEQKLHSWIEAHVNKADACVLSDYAKGVVTGSIARSLVQAARQSGVPVVVDPKGVDYTKYEGATVVTPNLREVEQVLSIEITGDYELLVAGQRLHDILNGSAVVITRGPAGMSLFFNGTPVMHIPAMARNVYDVTGAGDTAVGALALALGAGASLEQATRLANYAAGVVVEKVGTATLTADELIRAIG